MQVPKISIPPQWKGFFLRTASPLRKFQSSFIHLLKFLGLWELPTPQEFPIPSLEGVWIFSGTTHSRRTGRRGSCKQKKLAVNPLERRIFSWVKNCYSLHDCKIFSLSLLFSLKQKLCQDANTMYVSDLIRPNFLSIISFLSDLTSKLQCCHKNTSKFRLGKEKRKPLPSCSTHTRGLFREMFQLFSPSREIPHIGWPSPSWWSYLQIEFKANKYCKLLLKY